MLASAVSLHARGWKSFPTERNRLMMWSIGEMHCAPYNLDVCAVREVARVLAPAAVWVNENIVPLLSVGLL